jgi:uncharacterized membrane protein YidH (DUF202 family)
VGEAAVTRPDAGPAAPGEPWDSAVPAERTSLAWIRTGLALMVCAALLVRLGRGAGGIALATALIGLVTGWLVIAVRTARDRRRPQWPVSAGFRPSTGVPAALVSLVVLLAVAALGLMWLAGDPRR